MPSAHRKVLPRFSFKTTPNHLKLEFDLSKSLFLPPSFSQTYDVMTWIFKELTVWNPC